LRGKGAVNPLLDWLGDGGKAVEHSLAESRSKVCETCPENRAPLWWEWALDPIADCIRNRLEVKNQMNMRVTNEERLNMCRVCGCCLRLKVHTPLRHIVDNTDREKFPAHCWIRSEQE